MTDAAPKPRDAHPILFLILFLPLGITNGYVVVTLAYILSNAGVSVGAVAALVAWSLFPQTWKVVWAPIVDTTLNNKLWFLISASPLVLTRWVLKNGHPVLPSEALRKSLR